MKDEGSSCQTCGTPFTFVNYSLPNDATGIEGFSRITNCRCTQPFEEKTESPQIEHLGACWKCGAPPTKVYLSDNPHFGEGSVLYTCSKSIYLGGTCDGGLFYSKVTWNEDSFKEDRGKDIPLLEKITDVIRNKICSTDYPVSQWEKDFALEIVKALGTKMSGRFQVDSNYWARDTFKESWDDKDERNRRFLEEALEFTQARGMSREESHWMVDYVHDRPAGDPFQEAGGVMITFALACSNSDIDMIKAGTTELERCWSNQEKIIEKQSLKPQYQKEDTRSSSGLSDTELFIQAFNISRSLTVEQEEWLGLKVNYDKLPPSLVEPMCTDERGYTWYNLTELGKMVKELVITRYKCRE